MPAFQTKPARAVGAASPNLPRHSEMTTEAADHLAQAAVEARRALDVSEMKTIALKRLLLGAPSAALMAETDAAPREEVAEQRCIHD